MALNVIGSMAAAVLLLGIAVVQVPRAPPTNVCAVPFVRFAGRSSVNLTLVSATELGFVTVKVMTRWRRW